MNTNNKHTAQGSDNYLWAHYPKALRSLGKAGLLMSLANIWLVLNKLYLHWPGSAYLVMITTFAFLFFCFKMVSEGKRTWAGMVLWIGMAYISFAGMFRAFSWPGGTIMGFWGVPNLLIIIAAIVYIAQLPAEQRWSGKVLGCWAIAIPLIAAVLWYVMLFYDDFFMPKDDFVPAIPYADDCLEYMRVRAIKYRVLVLGNALAQFIFSLPLYLVARKQLKK